MSSKLHSPIPYFLLAALAGLVPVLNNKFQAALFPALSQGTVELLSVVGGIAAAALGFSRLWARLVRRDGARRLIREALGERHPLGQADLGEAANAGRLVSRMVRNADEDLREIIPDFSLASLGRLQKFIPMLLEEIGSKDDALVRLGVVGTYLGEVLCRNLEWKWYFQGDPAMGRFGFLSSVLQKGEKEFDPYDRAGDLLAGNRGIHKILKEAVNG